MLHDLKSPAHMTPIVGMLYAAVRENYARLRSITEAMSQDEVDYRGRENSMNSTAQLIRHLAIVDLNWVFRIKGQPLPTPLQQLYGPMIDEQRRIPMVQDVPLRTLMSQYEDVLNMLDEACAQLTDADLARIVTFGHDNEKQATLRWGLWHIADHSRYHQAQINLLRKWFCEH
ncbi:DinB family protein [Paenibacillus methanolicus]|uniref:Uncharacterized protein DUF664 n=1 Tax=Paenibacillus methanolicus TaxID=582686 RepID=A0A5S5C5D9_9BACL|nr:DinB family protein [Paenibacillus methanolicus]TYP74537.1 uncharacterized protein DUF664 [Paenibacillus methanolicus]